MPDDAFTPGDAPPPRSAPVRPVSSRRITQEIDEDIPLRDPLRVWRGRTLWALAVACIAGAVLGLSFGLTLTRFVQHPLAPLLALLGAALGAALAGFGVFHSTRKLHGTGERIVNQELPSAGPSLLRLVGSDRITTQPAMPMPPRHVERLRGSNRPLSAVAITTDGRLAAGGNGQGRVILWDVQTGFELFSLPAFKKRTTAVAFSPDGSLLAATGIERDWKNDVASGVHVWDTGTGQELRRIALAKGLFSLCFLPDGRQLLLGGQDYLRVWELDGPSAVALIDIPDGAFSFDEMRSVAVASDGKVALAGGWISSDIWLVNLALAEKIRRLRGHRRRFLMLRQPTITGLAFSPDGMRAVSGCLDQTARVWNVVTGATTSTFTGHTGFWGWRGVVGVAWLPDGKRALSASEDGTLRVWEVDTGKELDRYFHGGSISCLAVTPDGRMAVTGGCDSTVRVYTLR